MSLRKSKQKGFAPDPLDSTIRWALYDLVSEAKPSPHGWERLKARITSGEADGVCQAVQPLRWWQRLPLPRVRVGLDVPLYDWNVSRVSQTMRILENRMVVTRVVS